MGAAAAVPGLAVLASRHSATLDAGGVIIVIGLAAIAVGMLVLIDRTFDW